MGRNKTHVSFLADTWPSNKLSLNERPTSYAVRHGDIFVNKINIVCFFGRIDGRRILINSNDPTSHFESSALFGCLRL